MRRLLLTLALLLPTLGGWGQSLLWERRYSWPSSDQLSDVVSLEDGTVLAIGISEGTTLAMLLRLTIYGDTLYKVRTPIIGPYIQKYSLCRLATGQVYAAAVSSIPGGGARTRLVRIQPEDGTILWYSDFIGVGLYRQAFSVNKMIEGPNGTLVATGRCDNPRGGWGNFGYLVCFDTLGVTQWDTVIREHPSNTFCHHVEMTRDGNILVSGTAGSRIFAAEYAQDGFEIRRATFYQSASRINFDYNPTVSVRQAPGDRYLVSGNILSSPITQYIGLHQGWAGPKVWGGERRFPRLPFFSGPQVNTDGSITYFQGTSTQVQMQRLRADSSLFWLMTIPPAAGQTTADLTAYASLADSSAVCVGYAGFVDSTAEDWYAARITGMGIPYRPWQPTTATKTKASQPTPRPYPNPCTGTLYFAGLAAPGRLELYGTDGRLHLSHPVAPSQNVDVSTLPPGVYGYRLTAQGKVWRGRVVKR